MNNLFKRLSAIILALLLFLSFSACVSPGDEEESSNETDETDAAEVLEDFDYESADLSLYITLPDSAYKNNTVTLPTSYIISDEDVDEAIADELFDNKVKTNGDTQITDQPIKLGDSAFIYYTGYLDGEAFSGGSNASSSSPSELSIGSGTFIPGFEEGLIGLVPNETSKDAPFDLHVTFPENYGSTELAGKAVIFKVWVEYIVQYTIPEFNDDFVGNVLEFEGSAEEYREQIKKELQDELTAEAESEALSALMSKLLSDAEIHEYPEQGVNYWFGVYEDQFEYYMQYYAMYGYSFDSLDDFVTAYLGLGEDEDWRDVVTESAQEMVASSLVYNIIAKQQSLTVTDAEFSDAATELAEYYSSNGQTYTAEEIIELVGAQQIRQSVLFEKVDALLLENCTIEYKDE